MVERPAAPRRGTPSPDFRNDYSLICFYYSGKGVWEWADALVAERNKKFVKQQAASSEQQAISFK
ncbi:hypothetical protein J6590_026808 [Homalodisca vitripennis]|nr:hypothetical protein J6590_026808 [Homalodisca vitripennis]